MKLEPFRMERMQSVWENEVKINLSESGVHPLTVRELLGVDDLDGTLGDVRLGYPQSNGPAELRELIAGLYPGCSVDQVLATTGTAEANFISIWSLVEPGDQIVVMMPNYMQIWGIAKTLGVEVVPLWLREVDGRWAPDLDALPSTVTSRTKLIAVCNPNNPTGGVLTEAEMTAICEAAGKVGAWVVADEVYRGAELSGDTSPTFQGRYDRLLVTSGLSKGYGLPGLRMGWVVGPAATIEYMWGYKDYTTIGPGPLSVRLAETALRKNAQILERTRGIVREQLPIIESWIDDQPGLDMIRPLAGAIVYVKYDLDIGSIALVERLRNEKSVLVVPGEHFDMEHYLRIGFGGSKDELRQGLSLLSELLDTVRSEVGVAS